MLFQGKMEGGCFCSLGGDESVEVFCEDGQVDEFLSSIEGLRRRYGLGGGRLVCEGLHEGENLWGYFVR